MAVSNCLPGRLFIRLCVCRQRQLVGRWLMTGAVGGDPLRCRDIWTMVVPYNSSAVKTPPSPMQFMLAAGAYSWRPQVTISNTTSLTTVKTVVRKHTANSSRIMQLNSPGGSTLQWRAGRDLLCAVAVAIYVRKGHVGFCSFPAVRQYRYRCLTAQRCYVHFLTTVRF